MVETHIFDNGDWHDDTAQSFNLPRENALHHIAYFLRWLIDRRMVVEEPDTAEILAQIRAGSNSTLEFLEWNDDVLASDYLTAEGAEFAHSYYDMQHGSYSRDYEKTLARGYKSVYHIPFSEVNYRKLRTVIDTRYNEWRTQNGLEPIKFEYPAHTNKFLDSIARFLRGS